MESHVSPVTIITTNLPVDTPRLTPTGRISHAKTRVYTQRYRTDWERMPEFRGWLTSVPFQPTRAYCKYCKKNLHAHRLSLLKHTCTMKHQRSALQHKEEISENKGDINTPEIGYMEEVETDMNESQEELDQENEDEEIEYVVERLDDDILENQEVNEDKNIEMVKDEEIYVQKEEVDDLCAQLQSDEDDPKLIVKKVKLPEEKCRDPLAQAMAHVHSEYLDEEGEEMDNLEMEVEMVVESTDPMISDREETLTETYEEAKSIQEANKRSLEKSQEDININLVPAGSSVMLDSGTEPISFEAVTSKIDNNNSNKTVTLMCGSKTFTLSGGSFQPGTQYVLTKLQNKPTINDSKTRTIKVTETDKTKLSVALGSTSNINQTLFTPSTGESPVPGTSQISVVCETKTPNRKISFGKQTLKREYKKMNLTTHVIDSTKGLPVAGLQVCVYKLMDGKWTFLNESTTNIEGRCNDLVDKVSCPAGRYKIHYDVDKYFSVRKIDTLFPFIEIIIDAKNPNTHYHLPLLLSPFGYTTYRGS